MLNVAFLMFDGFEELDLVGPWSVFATAAYRTDETMQLFTISNTAGPVRGHKGLEITARHDFDMNRGLDILIIPGGHGRKKAMVNPAYRAFLREHRNTTPVLASVSTGAFLLAEAGLLKGRRATTHWAYLDELRGYRDVQVVDARVVDMDAVVTAGGPLCGLELALALVSRFLGGEISSDVARLLDYPTRAD